jgi:hypothetical protein
MKQNFLPKDHEEKQNCDPASCLKCRECKVINFEERRVELKSNSSQLYAKEAESYFFYYALNMKQSS